MKYTDYSKRIRTLPDLLLAASRDVEDWELSRELREAAEELQYREDMRMIQERTAIHG